MNMVSDVDQLIDIYDVWYTPWWRFKILYVGVGIFLLALGYIIWHRYFRKKTVSISVQALAKLQKLHQAKYGSDQALQDAYFQVTMIMKTYLSQQYHLKLLHKTDAELVQELKTFLPIESQALVQEFFQRAYLIKFAQAAVSSKMLYDDIDYMQTVIYQTIKQLQDAGKR